MTILSQVLKQCNFELETQIKPVRLTRIQIKDGRVTVIGRTERDINSFILQKQGWIIKTTLELDKQKKETNIVGDKIPYFGTWHAESYFSKMKTVNLNKSFRSALVIFAEAYLSQITKKFPKIKVWKMSRKLGGYSKKKNEIHLSVYLSFMPKRLIEYVIFHEYCHKFEQNHSKRFYALINTKYPFYKSLDKELKYWWRIKSLLLKKYPVLKNI